MFSIHRPSGEPPKRRLPDLSVEIDAQNSWHADSLMPSDTYEITLDRIELRSIAIRLPRLTSKVTGFIFPEAKQWLPAKPEFANDGASSKPNCKGKRDRKETSKHSRIKPPNDIVKLQDRLYYLLQPPLDLLVGSGQLTFPFEPFPYQLDGIAFLFPRYAGVLADEMGLGKTMQAISTIRLLLCSGELRSVLMVCPKPLVTNWLREFSVWAPEIPIVAIEGNAAKR
ncbi:MAG: DEAD/DEAH box helicase, partial [Pirellulaceae bacterium]